MHPILFRIDGVTFYTYGFLMALGFIVAYFYILRLAKISDQDLEFYSNMFFWAIIFAILGAKALYLIVEWRNIGNELKDVVGCLRGGLVWYGGLIADLIFIYFYCRHYKKDFLQVADTVSSPGAVGLAIGRWGCLMAGCCYGRPAHLPWAITYPRNLEIPHPMAGIPVHPSPIYESIGVFIIALICYLVFRRSRRKGLTIALVLLLYSALRFGLEFLRGDIERGFLFSDKLSTSQFLSALVFFPSLYFLIRQLRKPPESLDKEKGAGEGQKGKKRKPKRGAGK